MSHRSLQEGMRVLRSYPVEVQSIRHYPKGYLLRTKRGVGWLQRWERHRDYSRHLRLVHRIQELDPELAPVPVKTRQGKTMVRGKQAGYVLYLWPEAPRNIPPPADAQSFARWSALVGKVHRAWGLERIAHREELPLENWLTDWEEQRHQLLEEFDADTPAGEGHRLLRSNLRQLLQRCDQALRLLRELPQHPPAFRSWVLGEGLPEGFLEFGERQVQLSPWLRGTDGPRLLDLCALCQWALHSDRPAQGVQAVLSGYEQAAEPLSRAELALLLAYLLFPQNLINLYLEKGEEPEREKVLAAFEREGRAIPAYNWLYRRMLFSP